MNGTPSEPVAAGCCDMHLHSDFSDGSETPERIVELAVEAGLSAAVLTDHDTMAGVPRFLAAARAAGLRAMPGLEISADVPGRTVHMLAYGCDAEEPRLAAALERVRTSREARNAEIVAKLVRLGAPVSMDDVRAEAGSGVVGRPHIAAALVRKGFASDRADAFGRFLARGAPAYADRYRLAPKEAIALVRGAGGVAVLAHPTTTGYGGAELRAFVADLAEAGLGGMECLYSGHAPPQVEEYVAIARDLGLAVTGGTDFHGANKPNVKIGIAYGRLRVREEAFDGILARLPRFE